MFLGSKKYFLNIIDTIAFLRKNMCVCYDHNNFREQTPLFASKIELNLNSYICCSRFMLVYLL